MSKVPEFKSIIDTITDYFRNFQYKNKSTDYYTSILNNIYDVCYNNIYNEIVQDILKGSTLILKKHLPVSIFEHMSNQFHIYNNIFFNFIKLYKNNNLYIPYSVLYYFSRLNYLNDYHELIDTHFNVWYTYTYIKPNFFPDKTSLYQYLFQHFINQIHTCFKYQFFNYIKINITFILNFYKNNNINISYENIGKLSYASCHYYIDSCMYFIFDNLVDNIITDENINNDKNVNKNYNDDKNNKNINDDKNNKNINNDKNNKNINNDKNNKNIYCDFLDIFINRVYGHEYNKISYINIKYIIYLLEHSNTNNIFNYIQNLLPALIKYHNDNPKSIIQFLNNYFNSDVDNQLFDLLYIICDRIYYQFSPYNSKFITHLFKFFLDKINNPDIIIHSNLLINICRYKRRKVIRRQISKILLDYGIDVNRQDVNGNTALHYSYKYKHTYIIRYLQSYYGGSNYTCKTNINIVNNQGNKPHYIP